VKEAGVSSAESAESLILPLAFEEFVAGGDESGSVSENPAILPFALPK